MSYPKEIQERAQAERECYEYSIKQAMNKLVEGNLSGAIVHIENGKRSQRELESLQKANQEWLKIKQIEGQQELNKLIGAIKLGRMK